jgi:hypothetical protein
VPSPQPVHVFVSYARKCADDLDAFLQHTARLWELDHVTLFYDRQIRTGNAWRELILTHLEKMDLFVALFTPEFNGSNYCYHKELAVALKKCDAGECELFPINVSPVEHPPSAPLSKIQYTPSGMSINEHQGGDRDRAWSNVTRELRTVLDKLGNRSHKMPEMSNLAVLRPRRTTTGLSVLQNSDDLKDWESFAFTLRSARFDAGTWWESAILTEAIRAEVDQPRAPYPVQPDRMDHYLDELKIALTLVARPGSSRAQVGNACRSLERIRRRVLDLMSLVNREQ